MKEATARIKINQLLAAAGWRFFQEGKLPPNIRLEQSVDITVSTLDALGNNFEKTSKGFIDFLLLNERGFRLSTCTCMASPIRISTNTTRSLRKIAGTKRRT
jgi:type I restriction enzyme R subunit